MMENRWIKAGMAVVLPMIACMLVMMAHSSKAQAANAVVSPEAAIWTYCADEGEACSFTGARDVRYGAGGVFAYGNFTDGVDCSNGIFGDPTPGARKSCYYSNIALSGLTLSSGLLSPAFDAATNSYTANVPNSVDSVSLTPAIADSAATLTVNGVAVESGQASGAISLSVGDNPITVAATAQDGTTVNIYTITVIRAASPYADVSALELSAGVLSPAFDPDVDSYTVALTGNVGQVSVTALIPEGTFAAVEDATNGIAVPLGLSGNEAMADGRQSIVFPVTIHDNGTAAIRINVTAADQTTVKTYAILFRTEAALIAAQTDTSGQSIALTFNQPLVPESIAAGDFLVYAGSTPITVNQAALRTSGDGTTVDLTVSGPLYKWDRITVDVQGSAARSVFGSPLAAVAAMRVQNEISVFSPDFPVPDDIHITNIVAFLNSRHFDIDANGDGVSDRADIRVLLSQIEGDPMPALTLPAALDAPVA